MLILPASVNRPLPVLFLEKAQVLLPFEKNDSVYEILIKKDTPIWPFHAVWNPQVCNFYNQLRFARGEYEYVMMPDQNPKITTRDIRIDINQVKRIYGLDAYKYLWIFYKPGAYQTDIDEYTCIAFVVNKLHTELLYV
jgi:hypothetical protein